MIRRIALPALLGIAVLGTVPALADGNGSTEQRTVTRSCGAAADPHYSAPKATDCKTNKKFDKKKSYQSTYSSNDLKCGSKNSLTGATPAGLQVYGGGDPTGPSGSIGVCSDGSLPLQGRATLGGAPSSGVTLTVDGDKDNNNPVTDKGTGYAVVKAGPGGASVACGKTYAKGGNGDTDNPVDASQANCG